MANRTVTYSLRADTDNFEAGFKRSKNTAQDFFKALDKDTERFIIGQKNAGKALEDFLGPGISKMAGMGAQAFTAMAAGVAAFGAAAVGAFALANKSLLDYSDKIVTMSQRTGLSVSSLQVLSHVAKISGTDLEGLGKAATKMEVNLAKGEQAFRQLGLSVKDLQAMSPDAAFTKVGTAIGNIADPIQRSAAAVAVFGKAGADMLPVFEMDLAKAREEAENLGLVISTETMVASEALGDAIDTTGAAIVKFGEHLAGVVQQSPVVLMAVEQLGLGFGGLSKAVDANFGTLQKWMNIAMLMAAEFADLLAINAQWAVSIGKAGMLGWAVEASGIEKLTTGLRNMTKSMEDALVAKIKWASIDMGGGGVMLPGVPLPKQGTMGGSFNAMDTEEARAKALATAEKLAKAEEDWFLGAIKYREELEKINHQLDNIISKALMADYGGLQQSASRASRGGAVGMALAGNFWLKNMTDASGKPKRFNFDNSVDLTLPTKAALDWKAALQGVALVAGTIGGQFNAVVNVIGNIGQAFDNAKTKADKFYAIAAGVGQIGGIIGGRGGAALQGAAGGAMSGYSVGGPVGAAVGGVIGAISGWFGASAAKKKEIADLKTQLEGLRDTAQRLGIDLTAAFASNNATTLKAAIEQVTRAVEDQKRRVEGLSTAAGGLNQFTKGGGITDQASSDRAGLYAGAIFAGTLRESGDVIAAIRAIGPALTEIAAKAKEFGYTLSEGVTNLIGMNNILSGDSGLADQISGLNQMMKGLGEAGLMTKDLFAAFGADASAVFARLIDGGATANQALTLMQPTLQQLYEGEKLHGYQVDETTQALIDQGVEQGIIGDQFMSANERIVELLGIVVETLGGKLPESFRRAGSAADEFGRRASNAVDSIPRDVQINVHTNYDSGQRPDSPDNGPGFASGSGGLRDFGVETVARLHGREAVLTEPQFTNLTRAAQAGSGVSMNFGDINVHANDAQGGRDAAAEFERLIVDGRILTLLQDRLGLR